MGSQLFKSEKINRKGGEGAVRRGKEVGRGKGF